MRGADPQPVFDGGESSDEAGERLKVEGFAGVIVSTQRRPCLYHTTVFTAGHQLMYTKRERKKRKKEGKGMLDGVSVQPPICHAE